MNSLIMELQNSEIFQKYQKELTNKISPITLSGLSDVGKVHILAATKQLTNRPLCIVTYHELQAKKLLHDFLYFTSNCYYFPKREIVTYDYIAESKDLPYERIEVLNKLTTTQNGIIITTIEAIMQKMIAKEELYKNKLYFKIGLNQNIENVKEKLINLGYERCDLIEGKGQFTIRGGIVDIALSENQGIRIEFWGDEVDSIRKFSINTQRSTEMVNEITIYPAHEFLLTRPLEQIVENIESKIQHDKKEEDLELISQGNYISKIDKYFREFYPNFQTLLDYLPENTILCLDENQKVQQRKQNIQNENDKVIELLMEKGRFVPQAIEMLKDDVTFQKIGQTIYLQEQDLIQKQDIQNRYNFSYREVNFYKSETTQLLQEIKEHLQRKKKIVILGGNEDTARKFSLLLANEEIPHHFAETTQEKIKKGEVFITTGSLSAGFEINELDLLLISGNEIFSSQKKRKKVSSAFKQGEKVVFADLKIGDYVVHKEHGVGQFAGVNTIEADNVTKDYIKIRYKNDDMLYVPTNNLDNVRKFIGAGEGIPKVNKLGGKEWKQAKSKVKKNLQEVAKDLIELYAKRQKVKGYAFSQDTPWQKQFEESFPYEETEDQLRCIEETKKDMENQKPMDRLLCGDVGYGKTEVAIRAAFKAVMDQKQVAYLVPTTVLANQQYESFRERMQEFPIRVQVLNRFRTKKQQEQIIEQLKLGEIDVVVGTHRMLSSDVEFKDLGLLIIDEEHRFGVKAKEKIKKLKNSVDVLTMTATPIPRTLHMSVVGVRDMSVIYEPPQNRKPVQTYVVEYDEEIIREAITRELERDGQIYYLFNNVEGIEKKARQINDLVPEAKVAFAHGKMSGRELEDIMIDFVKKESNVLVCTTILESGIDIPNANTIIVENADRLGLAQLYQIRGRVGRADKQAYAYITYKRDKLLSEVADKRLKAIREFTEFGSGFKIAMRDLEIRGAGSLLGEIQHGHMEQVGYDTYCQLLDEVVKEMQGIEVKEEKEIQIDINVSCYIPEEYIENSSQKIEVYQNIALCRTDEDIENIIDELTDRYGTIPETVENLIEIAKIKKLAKKAGVFKITQKRTNVLFYIEEGADITKQMDSLIKKYKNSLKFSPGYVTLELTNQSPKKVISQIKEFLS